MTAAVVLDLKSMLLAEMILYTVLPSICLCFIWFQIYQSLQWRICSNCCEFLMYFHFFATASWVPKDQWFVLIFILMKPTVSGVEIEKVLSCCSLNLLFEILKYLDTFSPCYVDPVYIFSYIRHQYCLSFHRSFVVCLFFCPSHVDPVLFFSTNSMLLMSVNMRYINFALSSSNGQASHVAACTFRMIALLFLWWQVSHSDCLFTCCYFYRTFSSSMTLAELLPYLFTTTAAS